MTAKLVHETEYVDLERTQEEDILTYTNAMMIDNLIHFLFKAPVHALIILGIWC